MNHMGRVVIALCVGTLFLMSISCVWMSKPTLEEQKGQILNQDIRLNVQSSQAFLEAWGSPTYQHFDRTRFYPVTNVGLVPQDRVPIGEVPHGWENSIVSENGYFMLYADRGEYLAFIHDALVYREQMSTKDVHILGKSWKRSSQFRTTLEGEIRGMEWSGQ